MTLLELMVATVLGLLIMAMTLGATLANQRLYEVDLGRTRLNQNMRGALTIMGGDIKQAGERLPIAFPAIEIIDGEDGAPDELILRRNTVDEVLYVCEDIAAAAATSQIFLSSAAEDASPACVYGGQSAAYTAWGTRRTAAESGSLRAYIFNLATGDGEFFDYTGEGDSGGTVYLQRPAGGFSFDYPANTSAIYLLTEWHYRMSTLESEHDVLQLIENRDEDNPQSVIFGVTNLQLQAVLSDDTIQTAFGRDDDWTLLKALELTISGQDRVGKHTVQTTLSARFFPRNILSN